MKITDAIEKYIKHLKNIKNASPYTIRNYMRSLSLFAETIGKDRTIASIKMDDIDAFRDRLFETKTRKQKDFSRRTQNIYLTPVRAFLKFCTIRELEENVFPSEKVELLKLDPRNISGLTLAELDLLRYHGESKNSLIHARDKAIVEMLFSTGLRISELCKLDRENINLETREFSIMGKGKKSAQFFYLLVVWKY